MSRGGLGEAIAVRNQGGAHRSLRISVAAGGGGGNAGGD
jgi:hypothetical protein